MKKISTRIMLSIAACVVLTAIVIGGISILSSKGQIIPEAEKRMQALSGQYANEIDITYIKYENIMDGLYQYIINSFDANKAYDPEYVNEYMTNIRYYMMNLSKQHNMDSVYALYNPELMNKECVATWIKGRNTIAVDRKDSYKKFADQDKRFNFFYATQEVRSPLWLDPIKYDDMDVECITYAIPVYLGGKLQIVIGMDVPFDKIHERLGSLEVYESGYAFMLNPEHRFLISPYFTNEDSLESVGYTELEEAINDAPEGFLTMKNASGKECYVAYSTLSTGAVVSIVAPVEEVVAGLSTLKSRIMLFILIFVIAAVVVSFFVGNSISRPIVSVVDDLEKMQEGDFTGKQHIRFGKKKDEIGKLSKAINVIQVSMNDVVGTIVDGNKEVNQSVVSLGGVIETLTDQVSSISAVSEELASSMEETATTADDLSAAAERMEDYVKKMNEKNQEGNTAILGVAERAERLRKESDSSSKEADSVIEQTKEKLESAIAESKQVEQIDKLTESILNIAEQTNLLSLNASIEAARAGAAGRGFSVVADEIRKLAETSQGTAIEIQKIASNVNSSVENLCDCANDVLKFMDTGVRDTYKKLNDTVQHYNGDANYMKEILDEFSRIAGMISDEIGLISNAFSDLKVATADGADGTAQVAQNAEEVLGNSVTLKNEDETLEKLARRLEMSINRFHVLSDDEDYVLSEDEDSEDNVTGGAENNGDEDVEFTDADEVENSDSVDSVEEEDSSPDEDESEDTPEVSDMVQTVDDNSVSPEESDSEAPLEEPSEAEAPDEDTEDEKDFSEVEAEDENSNDETDEND